LTIALGVTFGIRQSHKGNDSERFEFQEQIRKIVTTQSSLHHEEFVCIHADFNLKTKTSASSIPRPGTMEARLGND
jgi:hypothetical protein